MTILSTFKNKKKKKREKEDVFIFDNPDEQQILLALWLWKAGMASRFGDPNPEQWLLAWGFWAPKGWPSEWMPDIVCFPMTRRRVYQLKSSEFSVRH